MNKIIRIFTLVAFVTTSFIASAQETTGSNAREKKDPAFELTNQIDRKLTLTAEQRPIVMEYAADYLNQIEILKKDKATYEEKRKELDGKYIVKMKEILTPEQDEKYEAWINELKAKK